MVHTATFILKLGSQTEFALKVHWDFRMVIYGSYGLSCHTPAPWVQLDVPPEVVKRLCDVSAVALGTCRLAAENSNLPDIITRADLRGRK